MATTITQAFRRIPPVIVVAMAGVAILGPGAVVALVAGHPEAALGIVVAAIVGVVAVAFRLGGRSWTAQPSTAGGHRRATATATATAIDPETGGYGDDVEAVARDWPRLRSVLNRAIDEIYVVDPSSLCVIEASQGAVRRSGVSAEHLIGLPVERLFVQADSERVRELVECTAAGDLDRATVDTARRGRSGEAWVRVRMTRLGGATPILLILASDRADLQAAEAARIAAEGKLQAEAARRLALEARIAHAGDQLARLTDERDRLARAGHTAIDLRDRTSRRLETAETNRERLAEAMDQLGELISIIGTDGLIRYVNRAWEDRTGFSRAEAIGTPADNRRVELANEDAAASVWTAIRSGRHWGGSLVTRRPGGTFVHTRGTLTPLVGPDGRVTELVLSERPIHDATTSNAEKAVAARAATASALGRLRPGGSVVETAHAICSEIVRLDDVAVAAFVELGEHSSGGLLGLEPAELFGAATGYELGEAARADLRARFRRGVATLAIGDNGAPTALEAALRSAGVRVMSAVPILDGEEIVAILGVGTAADDGEATLRDLEPALLEFGAMATALIGRSLAEREAAGIERAEIKSIIARGRFHTEFVPIVDLATGRPAGFEATAVFDDGGGLDKLAVAVRHGLGDELQLVLLDSAAREAAKLPSGAWIMTQASPDFILDHTGALRTIIGRLRRPVVIGLVGQSRRTFDEVRAAAAKLGPTVRLAADDRTAGSSRALDLMLLRPDVVQLSARLVEGIDRDPIRQSLARGRQQIAEASGGIAFARGVTTDAERRALIKLGVNLGEGPLFGKVRAGAA